MYTLLKKLESTRIRDTQDEASAEARAERASEHQRRECNRERNRLLWIDHFQRLAENHRQLSEEHDARARLLRETTP